MRSFTRIVKINSRLAGVTVWHDRALFAGYDVSPADEPATLLPAKASPGHSRLIGTLCRCRGAGKGAKLGAGAGRVDLLHRGCQVLEVMLIVWRRPQLALAHDERRQDAPHPQGAVSEEAGGHLRGEEPACDQDSEIVQVLT